MRFRLYFNLIRNYFEDVISDVRGIQVLRYLTVAVKIPRDTMTLSCKDFHGHQEVVLKVEKVDFLCQKVNETRLTNTKDVLFIQL